MRYRDVLQNASGLLVYVLLFAVAFVAVSAFQTRNLLSTSSGTVAPNLSAPLFSGGQYDLASAGDRPVLVYFFAPWCTVCALSSDNLTRLRRMRDTDSLDIIAVALDWRSLEDVRDYVEEHGIDVPVVLGDTGIASDWRVYGFPTYYVVDSKRQIRRRDFGYSTQLGLWWRSLLVT